MQPDPVLSLRGIVKTFPGVRALDGVRLDLEALRAAPSFATA